jgi:hypothetical protein
MPIYICGFFFKIVNIIYKNGKVQEKVQKKLIKVPKIDFTKTKIFKEDKKTN